MRTSDFSEIKVVKNKDDQRPEEVLKGIYNVENHSYFIMPLFQNVGLTFCQSRLAKST